MSHLRALCAKASERWDANIDLRNLVERTWNDHLRAMPELNDRQPNSQEFAWLIGIGGTRPRQCVVETLSRHLQRRNQARATHQGMYR